MELREALHQAGALDDGQTMTRYGYAHQQQRVEVLALQRLCPGYPAGIHGHRAVRTTQLDHVTPLVRGGTSARTNVRGLCASCNARKGNHERVRHAGGRHWRER